MDAAQRAAILLRLRRMRDHEKADALRVLRDEGADSPAMSNLRRRVLGGLMTAAQGRCLGCQNWMPGDVARCGAEGCEGWSARPYASRLGVEARGDTALPLVAPASSSPKSGATKDAQASGAGHCRECGKPLPMRDKPGRGPVFCPSCAEGRKRAQTAQCMRRSRNAARSSTRTSRTTRVIPKVPPDTPLGGL